VIRTIPRLSMLTVLNAKQIEQMLALASNSTEFGSICECHGSGRVACLGHRMLSEHELRRQGPMQPKQETEDNGERDVVRAVSRAGKNVHEQPHSAAANYSTMGSKIRPPRAHIRPHLGQNRPCFTKLGYVSTMCCHSQMSMERVGKSYLQAPLGRRQ
jgi:hypothetical protein